jgi:hypothetical protein
MIEFDIESNIGSQVASIEVAGCILKSEEALVSKYTFCMSLSDHLHPSLGVPHFRE